MVQKIHPQFQQFSVVLDQTSSQLHKTVIDYDHFQFMKEAYDYIFIFASRITTISRSRLQSLCLISITHRLRL